MWAVWSATLKTYVSAPLNLPSKWRRFYAKIIIEKGDRMTRPCICSRWRRDQSFWFTSHQPSFTNSDISGPNPPRSSSRHPQTPARSSTWWPRMGVPVVFHLPTVYINRKMMVPFDSRSRWRSSSRRWLTGVSGKVSMWTLLPTFWGVRVSVCDMWCIRADFDSEDLNFNEMVDAVFYHPLLDTNYIRLTPSRRG